MKYQVTILCETGKYKPVSTIIETEETDKIEIAKLGRLKICQQRLWRMRDLKRLGYTKLKVREYDRQKIASENALRYAMIKREKYASGEWKKPTKECATM